MKSIASNLASKRGARGRSGIVAVCALIGLHALSATALAEVKLLDRVVAVVNEDVITAVELEREIVRSAEILRRQNTKASRTEAFERQVLERLITRRVLLASARTTGVQVNEAELNQAISRVADENRMTLDQLREEVRAEGQTFAQFRESLRADLILARLRDREVDSRLVVTDSEVQSFLIKQETQEVDKNEEYNIAHILVAVPEQSSEPELEKRRARADEAISQLNKGAEFAQIAATYSDADDALQGGAMGWRAPARLPALFLDAIQKLTVGAVAGPVKSPAGFHIIKLIDKRGAQSPTIVRQTRARHILVRLSEIVSEGDALNRLDDLKDRIENGADFAALARLHSGDASAAKGGELGWISPGDTVPEFERAMQRLEPGGLSAPFRTPFGYHLVQVLERRDQDVSQDRNKMQARLAIRQRKSEQQWQDWVRYQRDKAYVEYHLQE